MLSFFLTLPYHFGGLGFGLGARYQIPLVHDGFIPKLNDSFELEFGADFYYAGGYCYLGGGCYGGVGLTIPVEAMWTFHIFPRFDAYGKLGLGINLCFGGGGNVVQGNVGPLWFHTAAGVIFHINDSIYLRGEIGWPTLKFGIGIPL